MEIYGPDRGNPSVELRMVKFTRSALVWCCHGPSWGVRECSAFRWCMPVCTHNCAAAKTIIVPCAVAICNVRETCVLFLPFLLPFLSLMETSCSVSDTYWLLIISKRQITHDHLSKISLCYFVAVIIANHCSIGIKVFGPKFMIFVILSYHLGSAFEEISKY